MNKNTKIYISETNRILICFLNNTKLEIPFITFKQINNGGFLNFEMIK